MIELGTEIVGVFGALHYEWNGKVVGIYHHDRGPSDPEVKVEWDNGSDTTMLMSEIRFDYFDGGTESKIGYHAILETE